MNLTKVEDSFEPEPCLYMMEFADYYYPRNGREVIQPENSAHDVVHTVKIGRKVIWIDGIAYRANFNINILYEDIDYFFNDQLTVYGAERMITIIR